MAQDIAAELALDISESTGGGGLPFIRHGKYYELLITRIHSKAVKMQDSKWHRFAFMEFKVLKSVPFEKGQLPVQGRGTGVSVYNTDDGTNPNPVGSRCSNSVDRDGNGAAMFGQNIKEFQAGFFGLAVDQISPEDSLKTWVDMCRKEDVRAGGVDYVDPRTNQPVIASKDKIANMACGYIIGLSTGAKELKETRGAKELPDDQRKYFTQKFWQCVAKPGTGVNAPDLVAKRRAQILMEIPMDDDDEAGVSETDALASAGQASSTSQTQAAATGGAAPTPPPAVAAPTPPAAAPTPPNGNGAGNGAPTPPPDPNWPPKAPWFGPGPGREWLVKAGKNFVWSDPAQGGDNRVIAEEEYRAGKR